MFSSVENELNQQHKCLNKVCVIIKDLHVEDQEHKLCVTLLKESIFPPRGHTSKHFHLSLLSCACYPSFLVFCLFATNTSNQF